MSVISTYLKPALADLWTQNLKPALADLWTQNEKMEQILVYHYGNGDVSATSKSIGRLNHSSIPQDFNPQFNSTITERSTEVFVITKYVDFYKLNQRTRMFWSFHQSAYKTYCFHMLSQIRVAQHITNTRFSDAHRPTNRDTSPHFCLRCLCEKRRSPTLTV